MDGPVVFILRVIKIMRRRERFKKEQKIRRIFRLGEVSLGFGRFFAHGTQGGSGDLDLFAGPVFEGDTDGAQIGKLTLLGLVVCVGYVVSDQGAFAGNLTSSCHL